MAIVGMNPDVVEKMGRDMQALANEIKTKIVPRIDKFVNQIPSVWRGTDAERFKGWWVNQHRKHLLQEAEHLHGLGQSALNNAAEQREASDRSTDSSAVLALSNPSDRDVAVSGTIADQSKPVGTVDEYMDKLANLPNGTLQIIEVSGPPPRYVILLKGVDDLNPGGNPFRTDLPGAAAELLNGKGPWSEAIKQAMRDRGIPAGSEVMLMAHSGGGIVALNLASDSEFRNLYKVSDVVIAGSGVDLKIGSIPSETNVLMMNNNSDVLANGIRGATKLIGSSNAPESIPDNHIVDNFSATRKMPNLDIGKGFGLSGHEQEYYSAELEKLHNGNESSNISKMVVDMSRKYASNQESNSVFYRLLD